MKLAKEGTGFEGKIHPFDKWYRSDERLIKISPLSMILHLYH
jgi:hypothetical protein